MSGSQGTVLSRFIISGFYGPSLNLEKALSVLGLPHAFTESDVKERFRELAVERHPDRNGTNAAMHELNEARDAAIQSLAIAKSMVPVEAVRALVRQGQADTERRIAHERAEQETSRVVDIGLGRVAQLQQMVLFMGGLSAVAAIGTRFGLTNEYFQAIAFLPFLVVGAMFGFYALLLQGMTKRVKLSIQHLSQSLADTSTYAQVLQEILDATPDTGVTRMQLEKAAERWLGFQWVGPRSGRPYRPLLLLRPVRSVRELAAVAGRRDFVSLLVARGVENGLLDERRTRADGRLEIRYYTTAEDA